MMGIYWGGGGLQQLRNSGLTERCAGDPFNILMQWKARLREGDGHLGAPGHG